MASTSSAWTDQQLADLFHKSTASLDDQRQIFGITLSAYITTARMIEQKAYARGVEDGMDRIMEAVDLGIKSSEL